MAKRPSLVAVPVCHTAVCSNCEAVWISATSAIYGKCGRCGNTIGNEPRERVNTIPIRRTKIYTSISNGPVMKQRRKELGINADQLADVLGIGISSLSRIERGKKAATVDVWEAATAYFDSYLQRPNEPLVSTSA